jgi:hypothetical protein
MSIVPPSTGFLAKSSLMAFSSSKNVPLVAYPSHNNTAKASDLNTEQTPTNCNSFTKIEELDHNPSCKLQILKDRKTTELKPSNAFVQEIIFITVVS